MNKLACAAISVAAPTLLIGFSRGITTAYDAGSMLKGAKEFSLSFLMCNSITLSIFGLPCIYRESKKSQRLGNITSVFLPLLIVSSACTYLALTSNPLFAIGAALSILPACSKSFGKSVADGKSLKKIAEDFFAAQLFVNSSERG